MTATGQEMEGEKSYLMPIILMPWWIKNRSNENELDKKVGRVGAWILIGGALGYLIWAPDY